MKRLLITSAIVSLSFASSAFAASQGAGDSAGKASAAIATKSETGQAGKTKATCDR